MASEEGWGDLRGETVSDDRLTVIERITFRADGGSDHVWEFPDGTRRERSFDVSPVMFQKGPPWGLDTAQSRGIVSIERRTK